MKINRILVLGTLGMILSANDVKALESKPCAEGTEQTCTYTISENGVLTISGTVMPDYNKSTTNWRKSDAPWNWDNKTITKLIIEDGMTNIGNNAFRGTNVAGMIIPNSVTSIGSSAFFNSKNLGNVNIPNGVTTIGSFAFQEARVASLTIPPSVTWIGMGIVYQNDSTLDYVLMPEGVTIQSGYNMNPNLVIKYTDYSDGLYTILGDTSGHRYTNIADYKAGIFATFENGIYTIGNDTLGYQKYANLDDYKSGTLFVYNEAIGKYQRMDKDGHFLKGEYNADGSRYKYRIYTVEEAERALEGHTHKNTFKINYR